MGLKDKEEGCEWGGVVLSGGRADRQKRGPHLANLAHRFMQ